MTRDTSGPESSAPRSSSHESSAPGSSSHESSAPEESAPESSAPESTAPDSPDSRPPVAADGGTDEDGLWGDGTPAGESERSPGSDGGSDQPSAGPATDHTAGDAGDTVEVPTADETVPEWCSLEGDERLVWTGTPSTAPLVVSLLVGLLLTPLIIGLFVLLSVVGQYVSRRHTEYVVTTRSLYVKRGILSRNIETVGVDRIQNTEFTQSFSAKLYGVGTIDVSTAGGMGSAVSFEHVADPETVRDRLDAVRRAAGGDGVDGGRRQAPTARDAGRDGTDRPAAGRNGADRTAAGPNGADRTASGADAADLDDLVAELRATREALERVERRLAEQGNDENR